MLFRSALIDPIPDNTQCIAAIEEAKWADWEGESYINLKWRVMRPAEYANRVIFQKLHVMKHGDKGDKAKRMLMAIDVNMTIGSALYYPDNQNIVIPNTGIVMNAETGEILSNGIRTKDGDGTINDNSIPKEENGDPPESPVQEQDLNRNQEAGSE